MGEENVKSKIPHIILKKVCQNIEFFEVFF